MIFGIASTMAVIIFGRSFTRATNRSIPACTISGRLSVRASIIPVIISGRTSTICCIISGKASTRAVKSCMPVSIICGMLSRTKSTIDVIRSGRASISTGIASMIPCASPLTSSNAAFSIIGRLSISP